MKFIPTLFSTPMVQALLEGRKTMTRRIVQHKELLEAPDKFRLVGDSRDHEVPRPAIKYDDRIWFDWEFKFSNAISFIERCKYKPGDVLWVRETWGKHQTTGIYFYKASDHHVAQAAKVWKPSIHMPKSACRIFLQVEEVKVERLQDINEDDSVKEGIEPCGPPFTDVKKWGWRFKDYIGNSACLPKSSFKTLWQSISGYDSWDDNPWVWVISFKRIDKPENFN